MKKLNFFGLILCMLIVSSAFVGCSKDDDDTGGNPFIGTWQDKPDNNGSYWQFTFKSDKTFQSFQYNGIKKEGDPYSGTYEYSTSLKLITITYKGQEEDIYQYDFPDAKTLLLGSNHRTFFKQ